jgi:2-desacetyl-2-hydroxyethyl bacteriochlorophyllide A dehydrogenase
VTGYQSVGIVEKVGRDVKTVHEGDRITVGSWDVPEGYNEGAGAAHMSRAIIKTALSGSQMSGPDIVPPNVSDEAASYFVLISVAIEAMKMVDVKKNDLVAVVGQGMLGQIAAQLFRYAGATVYTSDLSPMRAELSEKCGAHKAFAMDVEEFDAEIRKVQDKGADILSETTGNTNVFANALKLAKNYGQVIVQGHYPGEMRFPFINAHHRHVKMVFPCGFGDSWDSIDKLAKGEVFIDPLITHHLTPDDVPDFYDAVAERSKDILGAVIRWS